MPANLTPEYRKAEEDFRQAVSPQEKILALEHMMAVIPRHKGTEKMQADIKRRISQLRNQEEKAGGKRDALHIRREGAGQAILAGPPNCGKSLLMHGLTNARPEVGVYPFTTNRPIPGMMPFEDIQVQLVDTGPVADDRLEPYHINLLRNADLLLPVADLSAANPIGDFEALARTLTRAKIELVRELEGEVPEYGIKPKRTLVLVNKYDEDEGDILWDDVRARLEPRYNALPVSALTGLNLEAVRTAIFARLDILRVYSKIPGKPADKNKPFVLPRGSTVLDMAALVHKDMATNLRYARIWGSQRFEGQKVQRDYQVQDKDVIELHI